MGLGGQFEIADRLYGLRASYTYGINKRKSDNPGLEYTKDNKSMIAIGVYYPFGQ